MHDLNEFISGAIALGNCAIAFFFFRFRKKTGDPFFGLFSAAFLVLASERFVLLFCRVTSDAGGYIYLIRFTAFMIILLAIYRKNLGGK